MCIPYGDKKGKNRKIFSRAIKISLISALLSCGFLFRFSYAHELASSHLSPLPLTGGIDIKEQSQISQNIGTLLDSATTKKDSFVKSESAVQHYRKPKQKTWTKIKDASNFLVPWHGFGPSSEASDVILNEKLKLKSLESAEYARQKQIDNTHLAVIEKMLCLAESTGASPSTYDQKKVDSAINELGELTSLDDAQKTLVMIKEFDGCQVLEPTLCNEPKNFSVAEKKRKCKELSESFINNDPVVQEVTRRLHLYNQRGTVSTISGHVVETTLGLANLVPNVLAPASQGCLMVYEMANGGPEESKLIKELYLERRLQSRYQCFAEEAHLLLDTYETALRTHNHSLAALCRAVMNDLADVPTIALILNGDPTSKVMLAGADTPAQ